MTPRWARLARRNVATSQCCVWKTTFGMSHRRNVATSQCCFGKTTFGTSQRRNVAALFLENHVWHVTTSQRRSAVFGKPRLACRNAATSQCCFLETAFGTSTTSQRCSVVFEKPRFNAATFQRLVTTSQRSNVAALFFRHHVASNNLIKFELN